MEVIWFVPPYTRTMLCNFKYVKIGLLNVFVFQGKTTSEKNNLTHIAFSKNKCI